MRKLFLLALLLLGFALSSKAQNSDINYPGNLLTTTCTNANTNCGNQVILPLSGPGTGSTVEISTRNYTVASVTVRGTYAGTTINFEFSDDGGVTYFQNLCSRTDANIQEVSEILPTNQSRAWDCGTSGSTSFRVRLSAISSGTVNVGLTLSTASIEPAPTVASLGSPSTNSQNANLASSQSALTTAVVVKNTTGNLYGFQVTNGAASVCYLEFINAASAPALGTNAVYSFAVPASGTLTVLPASIGLSNFATGISVGMATAYNGSSACGTAATAVIFYF